MKLVKLYTYRCTRTIAKTFFTRLTKAGATKVKDSDPGRIPSITIAGTEPVMLERDKTDFPSLDAFWQDKSLGELAIEQAVRPLARLENVFGAGAGLWENEERVRCLSVGHKGWRWTGSMADAGTLQMPPCRVGSADPVKHGTILSIDVDAEVVVSCYPRRMYVVDHDRYE
ncbi:MAG TPA: hypothetical protein DEQ28_08715 [Clostridiales bacterium]|nr:hypothetical protein [Clostridiales bacterium]